MKMIQSATVSPAKCDQGADQCQHRKKESKSEDGGNYDPTVFVLGCSMVVIMISGVNIKQLLFLLLFVFCPAPLDKSVVIIKGGGSLKSVIPRSVDVIPPGA